MKKLLNKPSKPTEGRGHSNRKEDNATIWIFKPLNFHSALTLFLFYFTTFSGESSPATLNSLQYAITLPCIRNAASPLWSQNSHIIRPVPLSSTISIP